MALKLEERWIVTALAIELRRPVVVQRPYTSPSFDSHDPGALQERMCMSYTICTGTHEQVHIICVKVYQTT